MEPFDAVIFDCDGVLVESEEIQTRLLGNMARNHGASISDAQARAYFRGRRLADCMATIVALGGGRALPSDFEEQFRAELTRMIGDQLRATPGADALLTRLWKPYAVATNSRMDQLTEELAATGLLKYFDGRMLSAYDLGRWKPDPAVYLEAARRLSVSPHRCIAVEDSYAGIAAARTAGMYVLAYNADDVNESFGARVTPISALAEVLQFC